MIRDKLSGRILSVVSLLLACAALSAGCDSRKARTHAERRNPRAHCER
jgi:hypothetical protein